MTSYVSNVNQKLMLLGVHTLKEKEKFPLTFVETTLFFGNLRKAYVLDSILLSFVKVYLKSSVDI